MKTDFEAFQEWLEDHHYCKVVPCAKCYFWGTLGKPRELKINRCRFHKVDTWADDYCSSAVILKGHKENAGD